MIHSPVQGPLGHVFLIWETHPTQIQIQSDHLVQLKYEKRIASNIYINDKARLKKLSHLEKTIQRYQETTCNTIHARSIK